MAPRTGSSRVGSAGSAMAGSVSNTAMIRFSEPRDIETDFFVQVSWIDRRGDLIMSHEDVPAAPLLVNLGQQTNFVPEGGQSLITAQQEAIDKLAQQIVGQMELAW